MPSTSFYAENSNRAYPFLRATVSLRRDNPDTSTSLLSLVDVPPEWIVDAGFAMGLESYFSFIARDEGWSPAAHDVFLYRIYRIGDMAYFEFRADAPTLQDYPLTFARHRDDPLYTAETAASDTTPEGDAYPLEPCAPPLWEGYLVTGDLTSLWSRLDDGDVVSTIPGETVIEPALVSDATNTYVNDISVANNDRTRAAAPTGCPEYVWDYPTGTIFVGARCLQGDLQWMEGYNCSIRQGLSDNSLTIRALKGSGEGAPCEEVPLFTGEAVAAGSLFRAGGLACNETLRSINGLGGPTLAILAGTGVSILSDPANHKLTVDINMLGLSVCFSQVSTISEHV